MTIVALLALVTAAPANGVESPERPSLVRQIGTDFKNVFTTRENLATLGIGLGAAWGAGRFDQEIAHSELNSELYPGTSLDGVFEAGEVLGGSIAQIGGAIATYGLGKALARENVESLGRDLIRAQVVTQSLTLGVKLLVRRERPDGSNQLSFPSGHTSGAFASATVLQRHYGWRVGVPAYAVAGYVATSRLNEGSHYLSDVVFGATLGILVGRTVTVEVANQRFALSPSLPEGGFGIQLTWLPF